MTPAIEPHRARIAEIIALSPEELDDTTPLGRSIFIHLIEGAARTMRKRGVAGHWSYSLPRHCALIADLKVERRLAGMPC